ncbi:YceI family protein [Propioniferax innocua]|uniref:YceI-like domain-containing protein n=1 Tax=Propioniferax innocua TaxID=1753 RepID=A0A542ZT94_9ACTN|nr:YceI family protein [Propioniferax innocua]TQL63496.1 YceI-like domain-containing protein [Propioniferax innocua]
MTITPGIHEIGPDQGDLRLHTTCRGAMARMGHDLTLGVDTWRAKLDAGETVDACALRVTADLTTLRVVSSSGGAKPTTEEDHEQIIANAADSLGVATHPQLTYVSTSIGGTWDAGRVDGQLTLHGTTAPQSFDVRADGDAHVLTGTITQSHFGIKPFSAMMGALKLADEVAVEVRVVL